MPISQQTLIDQLNALDRQRAEHQTALERIEGARQLTTYLLGLLAGEGGAVADEGKGSVAPPTSEPSIADGALMRETDFPESVTPDTNESLSIAEMARRLASASCVPAEAHLG